MIVYDQRFQITNDMTLESKVKVTCYMMYLKSVHLSFHMWHNDCLPYDAQITIKISEDGYDFGFNGQGQRFLKVLRLTTQTPFNF